MRKVICCLMTVLCLTNPFVATATDEKIVPIQELTTPSGLKIWLTESHSLPMVSVEIAFRGGAVFDLEDKKGLANLTAEMLTQGAGKLSSKEFLEQTERLGANIGSDVDDLTININLQSLAENFDASFALLALAIKKPAFNKPDFVRLKQAILAGRKRIKESPSQLANEAFDALVYGRYHPYGQPLQGVESSIKKITRRDIEKYHDKMFTQKNMIISVVGAIKPEEIIKLVEFHFAKLPKGKLVNKPTIVPKEQPPVLKKITLNVPQTTIIMGHKGLSRTDDDYFAALFMNHILGGGGFSSILMEEVREKRGLAYGIYSYFDPMPFWGAYQTVVQTKNESAYEVVELVKEEINNVINNGVTAEQYDAALDYLVGSFPLRLDSNEDILSYLTFMQTEELGIDYLDKWVAQIKAVSRDDIKAVAKKRLRTDEMIVVMVGQPDGGYKEPVKPTKKKETKPVKKRTPILPIKEDTIIEEEAVAAPIKAIKKEPTKAKKKVKKQSKKTNDKFRILQDSTKKLPERKRRNVDKGEWL